jgi:hypothetical protein
VSGPDLSACPPDPHGERKGGVGPWPAPLTAGRHGVLADVVEALDGRSEADPNAVVFQIVAAFGNLVGPRHFAQVDRDVHHGRLWLAIIGTTAARKGLSFGVARGLVGEVDEDWRRGRIGSGLASGEALIEAVRDPDPDSDDPGSPDSRFLVVEPELASVLRIAKREGNTLSSTLRRFWDEGDAQIRRAKASVTATGAHVSVIGHITPSELRREVTTVDLANGFLNRFLLVLCHRAGNHPDGGRMRPEDHVRIVKQLKSAADWSRRRKALELVRDPEASRRWHEVYADLGDRPDNAFGNITSRAEAQVLRLSLVLAMLDQSKVVKLDHLDAALDLWRYSEESASILFGEAFADRTTDRIIEAIRETGCAGLSRTGLNRKLSGHVKGAELDELIGDLEARGLIVQFTEGEGRHKRTAYLIRAEKADGRTGQVAA